jgi:hypothetical protein
VALRRVEHSFTTGIFAVHALGVLSQARSAAASSLTGDWARVCVVLDTNTWSCATHSREGGLKGGVLFVSFPHAAVHYVPCGWGEEGGVWLGTGTTGIEPYVTFHRTLFGDGRGTLPISSLKSLLYTPPCLVYRSFLCAVPEQTAHTFPHLA